MNNKNGRIKYMFSLCQFILFGPLETIGDQYTYQCGNISSTLIKELLYLKILAIAEMAFSVANSFSSVREHGSVMIFRRSGITDAQVSGGKKLEN